ncbi:FecR domain-containing protein [Achromobacter seleniivolatilans]|uniref:FecR domain-containing protein n=1 Tax=Achromobacter seleniivolatilans TaxID=3047478 RepID=A0ABY9M6R8_9BURK|nr:FecR domain-containing protein [Achromobacter sp. R39]WMD22717.1 FecR domain-containing protein [Achromobacter sp. R39]
MNTPVDDRDNAPDDLQSQARVWLRLLTSTRVTAYDTDGFQRWLQISPAHQAAFGQVKQRWDALGPVAREYLRTHPDAAEIRRPARPARRAFLGAAVSAAAVAGVAVMFPPARLWPSPGEWGADDRTGTGEQRTLALADHVQVTMNTETSLRRQRVTDDAQGIDLLAGEAAIDLTSGSRKFTVVAGAGSSIAQAGRFEVRYLDGKVCVTCIEGAVRVEHPAGARALQARQQMIYDAAAVSSVARIEPAAVSAWRRGELVFNETRLSDVIAEINRYRSGRVVLMNDSAKNGVVSGRFLIASLDSALAQLEQMFDLRARRLPGGLLMLT